MNYIALLLSCRSNPVSHTDPSEYHTYLNVVGDFENNILRQQQREQSTHGRTYSDDEDEDDEVPVYQAAAQGYSRKPMSKKVSLCSIVICLIIVVGS